MAGIFDDIIANVGKPYQSFKGFEKGTHEVIIGEAEAETKKTQKVEAANIIREVVFDESENDKQAK